MEASRDHGKSYVFSYAWPLYNVQKSRDISRAENIALVSYSEEQSKKNLARIRKSIESTPELGWLRPTSKAYVWDSSMLQMSNGSTIETFGFGSSVRGGHYHRIIIDDPTKDHWTMSLPEQENFFFAVLLPALRRGGQIIVTGNPVEKKDLLEILENNKEFKTMLYPVYSKDGKPLWPEQYTVEDIEERKRLMPAHIFAREYMLKRVSSVDSKFKQDWIRYYNQEDIDKKLLYKVMTIDPAISPGGDALAAIVTGTDSSKNTYVLDRFSFRGQFQVGVNKLVDMMIAHRPDRIGFENFAFQKMYKIWLEEEIKRRGLSFYIEEVGRDSKRTKAMRIESLQPKLALGQLLFKKDHYPLVEQLLLWDPTSKTNDDDEIDALAWQVNMWRGPYDDSPVVSDSPKPGTFAEALAQTSDAETWMDKFFEDLRAA